MSEIGLQGDELMLSDKTIEDLKLLVYNVELRIEDARRNINENEIEKLFFQKVKLTQLINELEAIK